MLTTWLGRGKVSTVMPSYTLTTLAVVGTNVAAGCGSDTS